MFHLLRPTSKWREEQQKWKWKNSGQVFYTGGYISPNSQTNFILLNFFLHIFIRCFSFHYYFIDVILRVIRITSISIVRNKIVRCSFDAKVMWFVMGILLIFRLEYLHWQLVMCRCVVKYRICMQIILTYHFLTS